MSVRLRIPWFLQNSTGGAKTVEVNGATVGDCLKELVGRFPGAGEEIFDTEGKLSPFTDIHLGGRSIRREGLTRPVRDGDELSILLIIGGG
jgi:molybdopterin synthase sulfur carrier subunit